MFKQDSESFIWATLRRKNIGAWSVVLSCARERHGLGGPDGRLGVGVLGSDYIQ